MTGLAYRCNKDEHRAAALWIRGEMMKATRGKDNRIDEDGPTLGKMKDHLARHLVGDAA